MAQRAGVNVKAITDAPSLSIGTITEVSGDVTINDTIFTINNKYMN